MGIVRCCRGSSSVFLIIVFTSLLVLAGVIIDAARIMIAENRVQGALDSAVRSTLAGYHNDLVGEFGLYGVYAKPEETNRYFLANMQERHNNFNLIRYEIKRYVEVEYKAGLLDNDQFKEQILQYMKFKAPLAITENILENISESELGKKTEVMDLGQKAVESRAGLKAEITALNKSIENILTSRLKNEIEISDSSILAAIDELETIALRLDTVLDPRLKEYESAVKEYDSRSEKVDQKPLSEAKTLRLEMTGLHSKIQNNINILKNIELLLVKLHNAENDNLLSDIDRAHKVNHLKSQLEEYLALMEKMEQFSFPAQDLGTIPQKEITEAARIKDQIKKKLKPVYIEQSELRKDVFAAANNAESDKTGEEIAMLDDNGVYRMSEEFAADAGKKVVAFLSLLGRKCEEIACGTRNSLYIAEYVLDKYTYLTSSTVRDHHFKRGEVEYILCGDNSEITNVMNVFGQIWFMRFAVNTLYSFLESPVAHFLTRLAYSLVEGLFKAGKDICDLYQGKRVPLFSEKVDSAGYSDHLLILLLLQDEQTQLNRMRDLVEVNLRVMKDDPGFKLENCGTTCRAKAEVEINLWFAPVLHLDKLGVDRFKDGKYLIVCESVVGF